jgi:2-methylcitrate dehydratase PrpD
MISKQIAEFICSTDYEDLPLSTVENAKRTILDCLGVALAGFSDRNAEIVRDFACEMAGIEEATIWGDGRRIPAVNAALVNGVAAHALDYDDTSVVMLGHPSVISCPPVFAVGERQNSQGKELLAAYVLGGEVACRLGAALTDRHYHIGWHNSGTVGTFGSTAAAGKLLQLDQEQMTNAIGIAASMAAGLKKNFGTSCKPYHIGQAASNGIRAAILAKKGFTSSPGIFEEKTGFVQLFSGAFNQEQISERMGRPYVITDPGYSLKIYPSCAFTHSSLDCVLRLKEKNAFSPKDVSEIECGCSQAAVDTVVYGIAANGLEGKFSMPFCVALALLGFHISLEQFSIENCQNPQIIDVEKKVRLYCDPKINKRGYGDFGARVKIRLNDGRELSTEVLRPSGDPVQSLTDDAIVNKFVFCASARFDRHRAEKIAASILSLENISEIKSVISLLSPNT